MNEATVTSKYFYGDFEIYENFFYCPSCKSYKVMENSKHCPNCGIKLNWNVKYKEDASLNWPRHVEIEENVGETE